LEQKPGPKPLPSFREDLVFHKGPVDQDGSPTFNIEDPVSAQYYKITWGEAHVIEAMRKGMTAVDLARKISETTTLKITPEEVESFFLQAAALKLLEIPTPSEQLKIEADRNKHDWVKWLLLHYLYFRIPLIHPDRFLTRTLPYVSKLASKPALFIYISLSLLGIIFLMGQFQEFLHTFTYFFNLEGIITYGIAISVVKIIHEFAHAYTAKYYKIHVPTMGLAFLVMWPVLYTDVTDSWKLQSRKERLAISSAGMLAEFVCAGLCTLGWTLSSPGLLQSAFFVISSATWITSLLVNINPALRYDGYYILSDIWGIDNLQQRAFAVTRWRFREWFLGMELPCPEERLTDKNMHRMIAYAVYTFFYRLFLYTAIAIFIYYAFTKALGVALFIVEILLFFIWPVVWEISDLYKNRSYFHFNRRFSLTLSVLLSIAVWFFLPLPHVQTFPAITVPEHEQRIYVPFSSEVENIYVKRGDLVRVGDPLIKLSSRPLETSIKKTDIEKQVVQAQIDLLTHDEKDRPHLKEKLSELSAIDERHIGYVAKLNQALVLSKITGIVYNFDTKIIPGEFVAENQLLGIIADPKPMHVISYVPELYFHIVHIGQEVTFRVKRPFERFKGKVVQITSLRTNQLIFPPLSSIYGGDLPSNKSTDGKITLVESYYMIKVELDADTPPIRFDQSGVLEVDGPWQSKAGIYWKKFLSILWRESGI
jgi:putative peptide zinc metalloprotease protein